ncbi:MAG: iron ABC transporter permease [Solirubrobacteraceae bacterium]|nr:iron ABC transporter permease [Solirubrobacteraceae bacterium]
MTTRALIAGRGGHGPPRPLLLVATLVGAAVALPAIYLLVVVAGDLDGAADALWRERTARLLGQSALLAGAVAASAAALAVPLAWITVCSDLPGRRAWAFLVTLPLVVPSYVGAYVLVATLGPRGLVHEVLAAPLGIERLPSIYGFVGAWLVLTLVTYPLVLIPARAALRRADPSQLEAARGLGAGPWRIARTVVLPQISPAVAAGSLIAALYALSDFGAVSILRFDSFTRVIHQSYRASFDRTGPAVLAAVLILLMVVLVALEARVRRRGGHHRTGPGAGRPPAPVPLGRWRIPALLLCGTLVTVALVLPVGVLAVWALHGTETLPWDELRAATGNSLLTAGLAAVIAVAVTAPAAWLGARHRRRRVVRAVEAAHHGGYALPHIVVALALVYFGVRVVPWAYQTLGMAIFALVLLYVPLALGVLRSTVLQIPPSLEEAARGLGRSRMAVARTVLLPLARPGVLAGLALVFLTAIKELPAMVLLAPTEFDTLATVLWQQTNLSVFERAAVPALVLLAISAPPLALLMGRER